MRNSIVSPDGDDQLFFVTSYSDFEKLAHGPRGTEAKKSLYVYRFHPSDGSLVLLNIQGDAQEVANPAFSRHHPRLNIVYTCTEDCHQNGKIIAYKLKPDGSMEQFGEAVDAGGTSTCYLTIDKAQKNLLAVNYWNSTLVVIPMDPHTGALLGGVKSKYDPNMGKQMVACAKKDGGVNHSCNDASTILARQADPHSHALVLDPFVGQVAYVPDLGKDLVREFFYDSKDGKIALELNVLPSGLCTGKPDGPRYFEFHPQYNIAYVVNELSSTVAVFEVDRKLLDEIHVASKNGEDMTRFKGRSTLRLIQSISTIPSAFPTTMNTCGRMCVHKSGRFVIVSNRGHQSITVFKVRTKGPKRGELQKIGCTHTRGETPRHFQFDNSGQYLLVANQDTDSIAVFNFNLSNGELKYSGNEYRVPSPNFVCCCPTHSEDDEVEGATTTTPYHIISGSSVGSDSEDSTIPAWNGKPSESNLKAELAKAREEIEALKKLLQERS
jgi:6-phosphogluconolactonase